MRFVRLVLLISVLALALGGGVAGATHNTCDNDDDDVWLFTGQGFDLSPNPGVCLGDFGLFVDLSGPGLATVGVTTCDFTQGPGSTGCDPYGYFGLHEAPSFVPGPACLRVRYYQGGSSYTTNNVGVCNP